MTVKTPHLFLVQDGIAIAVKLINAQLPALRAGGSQRAQEDHHRRSPGLRRCCSHAQLMSSETEARRSRRPRRRDHRER